MKEVTTRTFGLLIAYLLPGFASLFCFAFWLPTFQQLIESFISDPGIY